MHAILLSLALSLSASADAQFERGKSAIQKMGGCFLVDFSYTETEGLKPGYERDKRVYDVNTNKSVKEWIYVDEVTPTRFRVQHVMFLVDTDGTPIYGTELKHTGEDWEYNAPFLYDFVSPKRWEVKPLGENSGTWTRRITNLDDGLRYQCAAPWEMEKAVPEWTCSSYAPIPGRETRDMGRRDYQGLDRTTRLMIYGPSFLERQMNTKIIHDENGKTPLAKELGKNWYVRLPDSECEHGIEFMAPRKPFWNLMRDTWDEVFAEAATFVEKGVPGKSRFGGFMDLEEKYTSRNLGDSSVREAAKREMKELIEEFRAR